jgi:UDP-GlcNAc:undecaprenyl-phosphate GlcNAc-1-phosphate transferase
VLFAAVGGACAGFLVHNRHPATVFLGDSGSLMLGFLLAATSAAGCTKQATALSLTAALLALAVPFLDTTQSFVRRFRRAAPDGGRTRLLAALRATAVADHGHIHHRLLLRGLHHGQVAHVLCLVTLALGLSTLLMLPSDGPALRVLLGALVAGGFMLTRLAALRPAPETADGDEPTVPLHPTRAPESTAKPAAAQPRAQPHRPAAPLVEPVPT